MGCSCKDVSDGAAHQFLRQAAPRGLLFPSVMDICPLSTSIYPDTQQDPTPAVDHGLFKSRRWDMPCSFPPRPPVKGDVQTHVLGPAFVPSPLHLTHQKGTHLGSQSNLHSPC